MSGVQSLGCPLPIPGVSRHARTPRAGEGPQSPRAALLGAALARRVWGVRGPCESGGPGEGQPLAPPRNSRLRGYRQVSHRACWSVSGSPVLGVAGGAP